MDEEQMHFAVIGRGASLGHAVPTNSGPYLISFRIMAGDVAHWGNRVINFGISPDAVSVTRVDEQIPLPEGASRLSVAGLTDLSVVSGHAGKLSVRFHALSAEGNGQIYEFKVGPRRLGTRADIAALEFELSQFTAFAGITVIGISLVAP